MSIVFMTPVVIIMCIRKKHCFSLPILVFKRWVFTCAHPIAIFGIKCSYIRVLLSRITTRRKDVWHMFTVSGGDRGWGWPERRTSGFRDIRAAVVPRPLWYPLSRYPRQNHFTTNIISIPATFYRRNSRRALGRRDAWSRKPLSLYRVYRVSQHGLVNGAILVRGSLFAQNLF